MKKIRDSFPLQKEQVLQHLRFHSGTTREISAALGLEYNVVARALRDYAKEGVIRATGEKIVKGSIPQKIWGNPPPASPWGTRWVPGSLYNPNKG